MFGFFRDRLLHSAKGVIGERIKVLGFRSELADVDSFLPSESEVKRLAAMAKAENFSSYDLALILVDAGYGHREDTAGATSAMFTAAFANTQINIEDKTVRSLSAIALKRHDDLLTEIFRVAAMTGSSIIPVFGSVGQTMKQSFGDLIQPIRR
jgi:hypothetical protein